MLRMGCDIETDAIDATLIHCIVCQDLDTDEVHTFRQGECYEEFVSFAATIDMWVGHNFISFDAPVIARLTGVSIPLSRIRDTLIMSQMQEPDRAKPEGAGPKTGPHSLESWGIRFKSPKIDFTDYLNFSEDMVTYCRQDVKLTIHLYKWLVDKMKNWSESSIVLEHQVKSIIAQQELNGFPLDHRKTDLLIAMFEEAKDKLEGEVREEFRPLPTFKRVVQPKRIKTGAFNAGQIKCLGMSKDYVCGDFSLIDWPEFNLGSRPQIGRWLIHFGWKPKLFTETGKPQVDEKVLEGVKIPQAQLIQRFLMLQKRIAQANSWIEYMDDDGRVRGRVSTIGAVSNRMTHSSPNIAQVPKAADNTPYGKECRECFTSGDNPDYVLFGTDASGLELRCLAHYMGDKDYMNEILSGDIHTANMKAAGLTNRDQAKTFIYAFLYGAGSAKIGSIVGGSSKAGKKLIDSFLAGTPALALLKKRVADAAKRNYIQAIDGRLLKIRMPHAALNQLLQGMGAIVCKQWLVEITKLYRQQKLDVQLVASIHDEYQFIVHKDHVEAMGMVVKDAIKKAELVLKVNCPLDCDWSVGDNWSQTH